MSFRQFWIQSRLKDELPELGEMRRPIIPLDAHSCSKEIIEDALNGFPHFPNNLPKVDGVLFYHQEAHYAQGRTPLVGWLKVFMIPEVLDVSVVSDYYDDRPPDYVNYLEFVAEFDKQHAKKRVRRDLIDVELSEA